MLVLSRRVGEIITIGNAIKVTVLSYDRGVVRIGVDAPREIPVHRKEVFDKIIDMNRMAATTNLQALKNAMNRIAKNSSDDEPTNDASSSPAKSRSRDI